MKYEAFRLVLLLIQNFIGGIMKEILVKLKQKYKQFQDGSNINLRGDLIIISGVNGSGKSQLIDVISGNSEIPENTHPLDMEKYEIKRMLKINDNEIKKEEIFRRTFKDNYKIKNFQSPEPKNLKWHKEMAWKYFSSEQAWRDISGFDKAKGIVENSLINKGFQAKPEWNSSMKNNTNTGISKEEFIKVLPDNFIWEPDDLFGSQIEDIFYNFCAKRANEESRCGREGIKFNEEEYLKNAPWKILNNLFEKLNFKYRFLEDYTYDTPNIVEDIILYPIKNDKTLDFNSPRFLEDLSDGEKAIISLTFASLNESRRPIEKILLLDEYDNTLNPSLTQSLFEVIEEFFIKKGVIVIMTTHSPVTISLAPDYASYYEMFKQDNASPKILKVQKDEYTELSTAYKKYYDKIKEQKNRIENLEKENKELEEYSNDQKILFVEDTYTQIYKVAWLKLHNIQTTEDSLEMDFENNAKFRIYSKESKDSLRGFLSNRFMDEYNNKRIVGLFDFDDAYKQSFCQLKTNGNQEVKWSKAKGNVKTGLYKVREKYENISAMVLPVPSFRSEIAKENFSINRLEVELLLSDDSIRKIYHGNEICTERVIGNIIIPKICNKANFWKKTLELETEDFRAFAPLFTRINELLNIQDDTMIKE